MSEIEVAGLILAAGSGSRFGEAPKLLAELDGAPLLEHAIGAQLAVPAIERTVVVLGAFADELLAGIDFAGCETVICPDWDEGQAASLRCGVAELAGARKVIVTLGDEPLITPQVIARFLDQPPGARATYGGRPGHPVVLGPKLMRQIAGLSGDQGARELLRGGRRIECGHLAVGADVDTPADLEAVRTRQG